MPTSGTFQLGTIRAVSSSSEIDRNALYMVDGYIRPLGSLSDSMLQSAVSALVGLDSPIDVTYASIDGSGHVVVQGRASHNSPVLILASAIVLVLAGIGITLAISSIYQVTDAVVAGGRLPGGAPGDRGSTGAAAGSVFDYVPLVLLLAGVYLFLKFRAA